MRIRDWQDVMRDVVDADVDPDDWQAIGGPRSKGIGEELYLAHPRTGVYLLKTYPKNPFEVKGVGTQVARSIDDEIAPVLPDASPHRFAITAGPTDESDAENRAKRVTETIKTHADAPTTPDALFEDMMEALDSPAFGPLAFDQYERPAPLDELSGTFADATRMLDAELDDIVENDGVGRGFD